MRPAHAAAALMVALAACSGPEQAEPPAVTADEQRALAEARSMIPANELPAASVTATSSEGATR